MIATGGTIASKGTADGLAPELTSQDILHYIPSLKDICCVIWTALTFPWNIG